MAIFELKGVDYLRKHLKLILSSNFENFEKYYVYVQNFLSSLLFVEFYLLLDRLGYRSAGYEISFAEVLSRMYPLEFSLVHLIQRVKNIEGATVFNRSRKSRESSGYFLGTSLQMIYVIISESMYDQQSKRRQNFTDVGHI